MREIIEALHGIKGKRVNVYTNHKLFGSQCINMVFDPETELGLGFKCNRQSVYVDIDDVVDWCIDNNKVAINGNMMSITIVTDN